MRGCLAGQKTLFFRFAAEQGHGHDIGRGR
jgi:hypothetical protein